MTCTVRGARVWVLKDALDDAAAVGVRGELVDLVVEGVNDELRVGNRHRLDDLLNDVVAVLVLDALHHMTLELLDQTSLLLARDNLERLLHDTAAIHLERELGNKLMREQDEEWLQWEGANRENLALEGLA